VGFGILRISRPRDTVHVDRYSLKHLGNKAVMRNLAALAAKDRATTANLLVYLAEVDRRRLYREAGYPSLFEFCVRDLHFSEDVACNRIQAARICRAFPFLYGAIAEGKIHLSAIRLLAPHLTSSNAQELIAAATHRRKWQIERMLAERFPLPEPMRLDGGISALRPSPAPAPGRVEAVPLTPAPERVEAVNGSASAPTESPAPGRVEAVDGYAPAPPAPVRAEPARVQPISAQRYMLQFSIPTADHDRFRHLQGLLSHAVPSGEVELVFSCMLDVSVPYYEKRKFGATDRPQANVRPAAAARTVPAHVRRAVWERDGGRCTYVAETGHRCEARSLLEFDHVDPVALGGEATVERMRLRCRTHNQLEAERTFGREFMMSRRSRE
jgi:hypothetical protein